MDTAIQAENFEAVGHEAEIISAGLEIPPCPAILTRLNQELHTPEPDVRRLAALIGTDVGLSAAVIKTVNSAFYGLTRKATGIEQAISILGLRACTNLVSGHLLRQAFPAGSGAAMERFWDRSMRVAGLAAALAARIKGVNKDEAHTFALFRDCGMLVMLRKFPQYSEIMAQSERMPGAQLTRMEDTRFRYSHARVGFAFARGWSLPGPLCGAILYHHEFELMERKARGTEQADPKLDAFGLLAEQVVALQTHRGLCPDWIEAERFVLNTLGLEADDVVELADELGGVAADQ